MNVGWSTGYTESYWGNWPFEGKQYGGSERIVVQTAIAQAALGHQVTVRLPWDCKDRIWNGVRWIGHGAAPERFDRLFLADDYSRRDAADRTSLVACRSDPPVHVQFDDLIFLSEHHAAHCGFPGAPAVGGGVDLGEYAVDLPRLPRRVICTSSPDRCRQARTIGSAFDFVHSYKPIPGYPSVELTREELIRLQQTAQAMIYPLDPIRPSDFFSMAVLEAHAAGTPVFVSDADAMPELWGDSAIVLPRPIDLGQWYEQVERLITNPRWWRVWSERGRAKAKHFSWDKIAQRYLDC